MTVAEIEGLLREGSRFLVACHRRPDADALGSALGMSRALCAMGKEAVLFVPDALAPSVAFLPQPGELVAEVPAPGFDATLVMDTAAKALLPASLPTGEGYGPLVVFDHHGSHDDVGDLVLRDVQASSTGEVVLRTLEAMPGFTLDEPVATPLYAAIVADTGGFRYPCTRAETLRIGAQLIEAGAEPWDVAYELFEGWERARLDLLSAVLATLETHFDGRLAILRVTRAMLAELGADDDMVEGLVNYGRVLRGVEIAALLWEFPGDAGIDIKISLRSRSAYDVSVIAKAAGGGGHKHAAGAQCTRSLDAMRTLVLEEAEKLLG